MAILDGAGCCEAVPDPWNGLDCVRSVSIIRGEFAEFADAAIDRVVADGKSVPAANDEIVLRDDRAPGLSKRDKDLHHSPLQSLANVVPFDFAPGGPNTKRSQLEIRLACEIDAVHPHGFLR